ncbi:hypothetical protein KSP39_PZI007970 [Platanthera zijinensis]|uniref:Uncharacterized protein n=1 Tax=Platanthera zijinensis TaxID=2320716 RepID=A0AAP0G8R7_9ASPA
MCIFSVDSPAEAGISPLDGPSVIFQRNRQQKQIILDEEVIASKLIRLDITKQMSGDDQVREEQEDPVAGDHSWADKAGKGRRKAHF